MFVSGPSSDKATDAVVTPLRKSVPCPQCGNSSSRDAYPFCSKRCADIDLGAWLNGSYAIAVSEEDTSVPDEQ